MGDGRPLLMFTGLSLVLSGGFALYLALTHQFLPHDLEFLGVSAEALCAINDCRVADFMMHDRAAFGGALISIGVLYMWLAEFPLRQREAWAWWLFLVSGGFGFGSFLAYLGYGYLDTWHGVATLFLLPVFGLGLKKTYGLLPPENNHWRTLIRWSHLPSLKTPFEIGRSLILLVTVGMMGAGTVILTIGTSVVFVPQDLAFMALQPADLSAINPNLIPLIAHDRAGFGGAILTTGLTAFFILLCSPPMRSLWQTLAVAGSTGFGCAIGIHYWVGYVDFVHLAPALLGGFLFMCGLALTYGRMCDVYREDISGWLNR